MKEVTLHHSELIEAIKLYLAMKHGSHQDNIDVRLMTGAGLQQFVIAEIKE